MNQTMQSGRLYDELRRRASEAAPLEFEEVSFKDGSSPQFNKCHDNVTRWILENPRCTRVRGWLVTSGFMFEKHSAVHEDGRIYDITPSRRPGTPFLRHEGDDAEFCQFQNQIALT